VLSNWSMCVSGLFEGCSRQRFVCIGSRDPGSSEPPSCLPVRWYRWRFGDQISTGLQISRAAFADESGVLRDEEIDTTVLSCQDLEEPQPFIGPTDIVFLVKIHWPSNSSLAASV